MTPTRWLLLRLPLVLLCPAWSDCEDPAHERTVGGDVELVTATGALNSTSITAIHGTYGPACADRAGGWTVLLTEIDPPLHPLLSVVRGDDACELTVTSLVADGTYVAQDPTALIDDFPVTATAFEASGDLAFHASARLSATGFDGDFTISLILSSDPSGDDDSVTAERLFLGAANTFALLAGTTITSAGATVVTGDMGVSSPGVSITGFPPGTISGGAIHIGDPLANQAQADVLAAYDALAGEPCGIDNNLSGQDLGGLTLPPGVYCWDSSAALTGQLVLDAEGDPDGRFVLKIGTTLTTATSSSVVMASLGQVRNVYWQVGTSVTVGVSSSLVGNLLCDVSMTINAGASFTGRALVKGAITMDTNLVSLPSPL